MTEATQEKRLCQCGTAMGKHPHSPNSKPNYFCSNCDVLQASEVSHEENGEKITATGRVETKLDRKYKSVMANREAEGI